MPKQFTVDARTILQLGRESIKDHTTALLELVKNAYDADATIVEVEVYSKVTQNKIRLSDNGHGMSESDFDDKWLRIGFSYKITEKQSSKRRRTGEKGIGRLSADRLGKVLEIKSKTAQNPVFGLRVNWELFDQDDKVVSQIPIEEIESPDINTPNHDKSNTGTELIITDLRAPWSVENVENLYDELSILTPPFKEVEDFEIFLKTDIEPDLNGKVEPTDLLKPELEVELKFDGKSLDLPYTIKDRFNPKDVKQEVISWKSLTQKVIDPFNYAYSKDTISCGPVKIRLLLYPRTKALAETANFSLSELRGYIDKNVGVKIYRDNISVKPYGYRNFQYGGDWLGIAERHSRNPAGVDREDYRVLANQLVGAIFITRDSNPDLTDSASREGFVENEAFYDLRALVLGTLSLLENRRYTIYQERKVVKPSKATPTERSEIFKGKLEAIKQEVKELRSNSLTSVKSEDLEQTIGHFEAFIKDSEQTSQSFEELLSHTRVLAGLATLGIAAAVFGHETQGAITQFNNAAKVARDSIIEVPEQSDWALEELEKAIKYGDQVSAWGAFALSRVQKEKRRKEKKSIKVIIERIKSELEVVFEAVNITFEVDLEDIEATVYPMDVESILINLITNGYTACLQNTVNRKMKIRLYRSMEEGVGGYSISVANSGPPIDKNFTDWIWEPLNTTKRDNTGKEIGTGLGLSIVKSIIDALKGKRNVGQDAELGGANFILWFPFQ